MTNLTSISLRANNQDSETELAVFDIMRPLFSVVRLEHFSMQTTASIMLNTAAIEAITASWPELKTFELSTCAPFSSALVPLTGLVAFANAWPNLHTLGIDIGSCEDLGDFTVISNETIGLTQHNSLVSSLTGSHRAPKNPAAVAAFLIMLFPKLSKLVTSPDINEHDQEEDTFDRWDEVQRLLPFFAAVQRQHRESA
jgi:hypothetical protein